jgi:hypothetical protein
VDGTNRINQMKISPHFDLREFVPKAIWDEYGEKSTWFVDPRLIEGAEWLRSFFGEPIIINNWHTGGSFQNRGFRPPNTTVGARLSQHKFGRAIDFNVQGVTSDAVYDALSNPGAWSLVAQHTAFTTMESKYFAKTWCHIDLRQTRSNQLLIVNP